MTHVFAVIWDELLYILETFLFQSVEFHERGKRHQENVKKKIADVCIHVYVVVLI